MSGSCIPGSCVFHLKIGHMLSASPPVVRMRHASFKPQYSGRDVSGSIAHSNPFTVFYLVVENASTANFALVQLLDRSPRGWGCRTNSEVLGVSARKERRGSTRSVRRHCCCFRAELKTARRQSYSLRVWSFTSVLQSEEAVYCNMVQTISSEPGE